MTTLVASEHHLRIFRPEVDATCRTHQNQGKIMSAPRHPPVTNQAFVNLPGRKSRLKTANIIRRIREHARSHAEQPSERGKERSGSVKLYAIWKDHGRMMPWFARSRLRLLRPPMRVGIFPWLLIQLHRTPMVETMPSLESLWENVHAKGDRNHHT
jgi:hypothetical protein